MTREVQPADLPLAVAHARIRLLRLVRIDCGRILAGELFVRLIRGILRGLLFFLQLLDLLLQLLDLRLGALRRLLRRAELRAQHDHHDQQHKHRRDQA